MSNGIPQQLADHDLLKIYGPTANCDHPGKQPIGSTTDGPFYKADDPELVRHIENGGNVGFPLSGSIIVFDVDHDRFGELLDDKLPPTFTIRTGSGGEHRYYHAPDWTDNRQLTVDGTDYGSIRADGWQVVIPPSVHPETENRYQVEADRKITSVGPDEIAAVIEEASDRGWYDSANTAGAAAATGGGGGGVGGGSDAPIPDEYPNREADWSTLRTWLQSNGFLDDLNQTMSSDWSGLEFKLAKCLAEGGFSEASISDVLNRLHHNSKWHREGPNYRNLTVQKAIEAACDDPYVEFSSTGDMEAEASESRKTEESGEGRTLPGGDT